MMRLIRARVNSIRQSRGETGQVVEQNLSSAPQEAASQPRADLSNIIEIASSGEARTPQQHFNQPDWLVAQYVRALCGKLVAPATKLPDTAQRQAPLRNSSHALEIIRTL